MAAPGWYPDPAGSGGFRYWDGTRWTERLSPTASAPPPPPGGPSTGGGPVPHRSRPERGGRGPLIALLAVVAVVIVVVVLVVVRPWGGDGHELTGPQPTPTVSAWNDGTTPSAPTSSASARSASPSLPSPSPTDSESAHEPPDSVSCPSGDPLERAAYPEDGRVHGGGLSFIPPADYDEGLGVLGMSFAYDVATADYNVVSTWYSIFAVGALHTDDGFTSPRQAARAVMQCVASSQWYDSMTGTEPVHDKAVTVDGHQAWSVRTKVLCDYTSAPEVKGDVVEVIVVDTGTPGQLGVFMGQATIDDAHTVNALKATLASLQVD